MNVILLDKVENLGEIGDMVNVKPGYGRNYLLPQGKAALATKQINADAAIQRIRFIDSFRNWIFQLATARWNDFFEQSFWCFGPLGAHPPTSIM